MNEQLSTQEIECLFESAMLADGYQESDFVKHGFGQYYLSHLNVAFVYFCKGVAAICNQKSLSE